MKKIISAMNSYGFEVRVENNEYFCFNKTSNKGFILDCILNLNELPIDDIIEEYERVYLIIVQDNEEQVMDAVEKLVSNNIYVLIYDENDEFEYFMKDLWNLILSL